MSFRRIICVITCTMIGLILLSSCGTSQEIPSPPGSVPSAGEFSPEAPPELTEEQAKSTFEIPDSEKDNNIDKKAYRNEDGQHTLVLWDYDSNTNQQTMVFDGLCKIIVYNCSYDSSFQEGATLIEGSATDDWTHTISLLYHPEEDYYNVALGVGGEHLLFGGVDYSGRYDFCGNSILSEADVNHMEPALPEYFSRANGSWSCASDVVSSTHLIINADRTFTMFSSEYGKTKDVIIGSYVIDADDGVYQTFLFTDSVNKNNSWSAKLRQTMLTDNSGYSYDGIIYEASDGNTLYFTGVHYE